MFAQVFNRYAYRETAPTLGCHFFDAGSVRAFIWIDDIHLDEDHHYCWVRRLGDWHAIAPLNRQMPPPIC